MGDLYRLRFARGAGREIYDEIIAAAPNGRCPYCGHGEVRSLDHFLPVSLYSTLAVNPRNLIPSCSDCNRSKLDFAPGRAEDVLIHPYYDDFNVDQWLVAEVIEDDPAALIFKVSAPPSWTTAKAERVINHFTTFGLSELYSSQAADELLNIRFGLSELSVYGGPVGVADHLECMAASRRALHVNSWQTASYTAWAESDWFCSHGFS